VKFDQAQSETFRKFGSSGIPYLVLIDNEGNAVTAQPGNEWQSPQAVLQIIEEKFAAADSDDATSAQQGGGTTTK
jgi:thioredoxin-related protein